MRKIGDWVADEQSDTLVCGEERRKVERRAMAALSHLADRAGHVVSKDELIDTVWAGVTVSDHSVAIVISQLRRAMGDDRAAPKYIETIAKRGYRLLAPVTEAELGEVSVVGDAVSPLKQIDRRVLFAAGGALALGIGAVGLYPYIAGRRFAVAVADFISGEERLRDSAFALSEMVSNRIVQNSDARVLRWRGETTPDGLRQLRANSPSNVALLTGYVFSDRGADVVAVQVRDLRTNNVLRAGVYPLEGALLIARAENIADDAAVVTGNSVAERSVDANVPPEALARYWEARYALNTYGAGGRRHALDLLVDLTNDYPQFVSAHIALAVVYCYTTPETLGMESSFDTFAAAGEQLAIARRLGGESAEIETTAAYVEFMGARDFDVAYAHAMRATELEPNYAQAWQMLALILSVGQHYSAALTAVERAEELDPASLDIRWDHVWFLYVAGRYAEALRESTEAAVMTAANPLYTALVYDALGKEQEAFAQWIVRARQRGLDARGVEAAVQAGRGNLVAGYVALLEQFNETYSETGLPLAVLCMNARQRDRAVQALVDIPANRERWFSLYVDRVPNLRSLQGDGRLNEVLGRIADFRA